MKDLCKNCPKKPECTKLCEKASKYVNQDYVRKSSYVKREVDYGEMITLSFLADSSTLTHQEMINSDFPLGNSELYHIKKANLTTRQYQCLYLYYWSRYNQKDIAKKLKIAQQSVSKHIKRAKAKILKLLKNNT